MSLRGALAATLLGLAATAAQAWSQHAAMAYRAFEVMPEVARAAPVTAEPLEAFLRAQPAAIAQAVEAQEAWARAHLKNYPARPDALRWQWAAGQADADLRKGFLAAMRLSPQSRFALFVQLDPWAAAPTEPSLDWAQAASVPPSKGAVHRLRALHPGEPVPALAVLASACDEPDYGLDLQLFDDNPGSPSGYGFGKQPFGNPAVAIGSQAPFHMGFLHQGRVFDTLAPSLTRSLVELRVAQFSALARLAFGTGHAYWGWRFAGLAAHYVQDLTQPYHASAAPGESLPGMLWANTAAALGMPAAKQALVILQATLQSHFLTWFPFESDVLSWRANGLPDDVRIRRGAPTDPVEGAQLSEPIYRLLALWRAGIVAYDFDECRRIVTSAVKDGYDVSFVTQSHD